MERSIFSYFKTFYIDLMYQSSFVVTYFVTTLAVVFVFARNIKSVKDLAFRVLEYIFVWGLGIFGNSLVYMLQPGPFAQPKDSYVELIVIVVYAIIFCRYDWRIRAVFASFLYAFYLSSLSISQIVGWYTNSWFSGSSPLTFITQNAIVIAAALFLRFSKVNRRSEVSAMYCLLMALVSWVHIILNLFISSWRVDDRVSVMLNLGYMCIEIVAFIIYNAATKEMNEKNSALEVALRSERDKYLMNLARAEIEKLRTVRHDIKNNYAYMELLLNDKRYDELSEYFKKYTCELYDSVKFSVCGNETIDYILSIELNKAEQKDIKIDYSIAVAPVLPIKDTELCSLITNVLDNAIEGTERIEGLSAEERKINFSITQKGETLLIHADNPVLPGVQKENGVFKTSKSDGRSHGLGIKIIKGIAKKYKGAAVNSVEGGRFISDVMLSLVTPTD